MGVLSECTDSGAAERRVISEAEASAAMWEELAKRFQQLYLTPGQEAQYREIVLRGKDAERTDLSHFVKDPADRMFTERTPAGDVTAVCIRQRADFELFLQIMAKKCRPAPIPATQGAAILDGLIDWPAIRAHRASYLVRCAAEGGTPDWSAEFKRFTADKRNYTTALIVLSRGPYSGLSAAEAGVPAEEWLEKSLTIRTYHECTHFVCRRLFPEKKDAVWDELVADAEGLLAAFGTYSVELAERLLGIENGRYTGGRLENYVQDGAAPEEWVPYCRALAERLAAASLRGGEPYELALHMEREKGEIEAALPLKPAAG